MTSTELSVIDTETTESTALATFDPRPSAYIENIKIEVYSEYIVPVSFGGKTQNNLSASGIEHLAAELGISIVNQEWNKSDTHYFMTSTAECCHTQRKSVATVSQPKQMTAHGKVKDDPNHWRKQADAPTATLYGR